LIDRLESDAVAKALFQHGDKSSWCQRRAIVGGLLVTSCAFFRDRSVIARYRSGAEKRLAARSREYPNRRNREQKG
jgi:hypothetical protein